jgi:histidinol-phosphatase (PHP family)
MRDTPARVSIHGGHSGEFCTHASDTLEELVQAYIRQGFGWVGLTEHMPPVEDRFRYADEADAGLTASALYARFERYMATGRALQKKYARQISLYIGFETETYTGAYPFIERLVRKFAPDYIVGSVHHVADQGIDATAAQYQRLAQQLGGVDALYKAYFDVQYDMLVRLKPQVVGHFDLVRIFDPDYRLRMENTSIRRRIQRNLEAIRSLNLIMDFNLRPLQRGESEPYITRSILQEVRDLGIAVIPGDDAHSAATAGNFVDDGIHILRTMGFDTNWRRPVAQRPPPS